MNYHSVDKTATTLYVCVCVCALMSSMSLNTHIDESNKHQQCFLHLYSINVCADMSVCVHTLEGEKSISTN